MKGRTKQIENKGKDKQGRKEGGIEKEEKNQRKNVGKQFWHVFRDMTFVPCKWQRISRLGISHTEIIWMEIPHPITFQGTTVYRSYLFLQA